MRKPKVWLYQSFSIPGVINGSAETLILWLEWTLFSSGVILLILHCSWNIKMYDSMTIFCPLKSQNRQKAVIWWAQKGLNSDFMPTALVLARWRHRIPSKSAGWIPNLYLQEHFSFTVVIFHGRKSQYLWLQRAVCFPVGIDLKKEDSKILRIYTYSEVLLAL